VSVCIPNQRKVTNAMMMVSGNYNFPSNGYYNPPKPRVTTKNYQEALQYGDDAKYGGNGDGKLDATELTSIKKVFDYASDYYKNMYQQSGDTKYMAWSNHYSNSSTATGNMSKNFDAFATFKEVVRGGGSAASITKEDIDQLANKDGNGNTISLNDLAKNSPRSTEFKHDGLATAHYENTVNYGDDKRYGGDGDGTVDATELTNVKKTFDYAADYYKNQASLATSKADKEKFMAWSNYYGNDAKAAENMMNNMSAFQDNNFSYFTVMKGPGEPPNFNATLDSIKELAGRDGNTETISLLDLARTRFPFFVENDPPIELGEPKGGPHRPMYNQPPQYGGGQYGQYPPMYNQPPQYGGGQYGQYPPMYNQPPQYGGGQYGQYPPMGGQYPPMGGQYPSMSGQYPLMGEQYPPMGGQYPPMGGQYPPMGGQYPPMGGQPPYGMNAPFPAMQPQAGDLTYLQTKAGNPQAWDGVAFAQGSVSRSSAVDTSRDGQISYAEAINSPDGLLGNGILRLPPDSPQTRALWDALSGPDGKINPQELAAAILSVDGNTNGTVTAQEANKFLQDTMARLAQNPNAAISTYNNFQARGNAFGLDKFLQNPEAAYALQVEQQLNAQQQGQTRGDTLGLLQQAEQARLQYGLPQR